MAYTKKSFTKLPKLVRDNIPSIILQNEGLEVLTKILEPDDYLLALKNKLIEEAYEVLEAKNDTEKIKEELADVYEVVECITKFLNIESNRLKELQLSKRAKNGSFSKRILLIKK